MILAVYIGPWTNFSFDLCFYYLCPNASRLVLEFQESLFLLLRPNEFRKKERLHGKILGEVAQRINHVWLLIFYSCSITVRKGSNSQKSVKPDKLTEVKLSFVQLHNIPSEHLKIPV